MAVVDQPVPPPDSPLAGPSAAASDGIGRAGGPARRRLANGPWVGSLLYGLFLLFLILFALQAAQHHRWPHVAGILAVFLLFLVIPAGGRHWWHRTGRGRKSPEPPSSPT